MQHQHSHATVYNRYPEIFKKCVDICQLKSPKILSFGCSTGEEAFSLAESYFKTSEIHGVDISPEVIEKAKQNNKFSNIQFYTYSHLLPDSKFDIIFCMSVLCNWPATKDATNCHEYYQFDKFEKELIKLDAMLNEGGILVIYNSNFCFSDTILKHKYKAVVDYDVIRSSGFVNKFDKNHELIKYKYNECIFIKRPENEII
jgi:chemotaxis methyl-accepting protein methylase